MENAVDALKMAAAVLVFVTALGISIASFSQARATADILVTYLDSEYTTQYATNTGVNTRLVGAETIIPTIFRAYNENYRIVFYDGVEGNILPLFSQNDEDGNLVEINYIDLEKETLGTNRNRDNFIMALLYGSKAELIDANGNEIDFDDFVDQIEINNEGITLDSERNLC